MANLNKIILVGRLLDQPEARLSVNGMAVTKFKMETSNFPGGEVNFIDVVTWQRLAEICGQFLHKGKLVLVEGRLQVRSYEDQGGQRKWVTEVAANNMQMLDPKTAQAVIPTQAAGLKNESPAEEPHGFEEVEELPEDDLPF